MAFMKWQQNTQNLWHGRIVKQMLISRVHTTICTNSKLSVIDVVKTLARCFWGLKSRKVLSFAVYKGLFWGWNQSVFWPRSLQQEVCHILPTPQPQLLYRRHTNEWIHLSQSLTAGQNLFPKKGRNMWAMGAKHNWAYYSWAHELTDWFLPLFSGTLSQAECSLLCKVE